MYLVSEVLWGSGARAIDLDSAQMTTPATTLPGVGSPLPIPAPWGLFNISLDAPSQQSLLPSNPGGPLCAWRAGVRCMASRVLGWGMVAAVPVWCWEPQGPFTGDYQTSHAHLKMYQARPGTKAEGKLEAVLMPWIQLWTLAKTTRSQAGTLVGSWRKTCLAPSCSASCRNGTPCGAMCRNRRPRTGRWQSYSCGARPGRLYAENRMSQWLCWGGLARRGQLGLGAETVKVEGSWPSMLGLGKLLSEQPKWCQAKSSDGICWRPRPERSSLPPYLWGSLGLTHTLPSDSSLFSSNLRILGLLPLGESGTMLSLYWVGVNTSTLPPPPTYTNTHTHTQTRFLSPSSLGLTWGICFQSPPIAPLLASPRTLTMFSAHP